MSINFEFRTVDMLVFSNTKKNSYRLWFISDVDAYRISLVFFVGQKVCLEFNAVNYGLNVVSC